MPNTIVRKDDPIDRATGETPASATTKLDLSNDPTIKGKAGAVAWYRGVMGLSSVGMGLVTKATNDRTLPSYKISGAIWYSTADLWNFIQGMRRTAQSERWFEKQ
jgi:hypothetical protein